MNRIDVVGRACTLAHLAIIVMCLGACSRAPSQYTVEYYEKNVDERKQKLTECANDPGSLRDDPLCINARAADFGDAIGSLRDLPPMRLPGFRRRWR